MDPIVVTSMPFIIKEGKICGYEAERMKFSESEDFAIFHRSFIEYCKHKNYFIFTKAYTPKEYCEYMHIDEDINNNISIEDFDKIIADKYGFWNYGVDDTDLPEQNPDYLIPVKFSDGEIRLVEVLY